jgi:hypothetical protein
LAVVIIDAPSLIKARLKAAVRKIDAGAQFSDHQKRDAVLAAVKDAARRLRRWPATIPDRVCVRRHWARAGRDEETVLRSNQETDLEKLENVAPAAG